MTEHRRDVDDNYGNSSDHPIERHRLALYYHIVLFSILGAAKPTRAFNYKHLTAN